MLSASLNKTFFSCACCESLVFHITWKPCFVSNTWFLVKLSYIICYHLYIVCHVLCIMCHTCNMSLYCNVCSMTPECHVTCLCHASPECSGSWHLTMLLASPVANCCVPPCLTPFYVPTHTSRANVPCRCSPHHLYPELMYLFTRLNDPNELYSFTFIKEKSTPHFRVTGRWSTRHWCSASSQWN